MEARPWHQHYDPQVPASLRYEEVTLPQFLHRTASRVPQAPALAFLNARLTYRELTDDVDRLAAAMAHLGIKARMRVAIHLPNTPQAVIAYYAALSLGAHVVLTNPVYTAREIEHQWNDAGCVLAVTADYLYAQHLQGIRGRLSVKNFIVASFPEYLRFPLSFLAPFKLRRASPPAIAPIPRDPSVHPFRRLVRRTAPAPPRPVIDMEDVAVLQYTGGTTGVSKAAMLTHRNLSVNVQQYAAWNTRANRFGEEVVLTALPLFHVFGMTCCMNWGIANGALLVLLPNPRDVATLVKSVSRHRVTLFPGVPSMYNSLNNFRGIEGFDVKSVKVCLSGSAPIPPDVLERFEKLTGARIIEGFGMSESSPVTHANPVNRERRIGSIGLPLPDTDSRVVDIEDGRRELAPGEEGELIVRGPQVMKGYWNRPDETDKALRGGWLFTGDVATMSEDGYFKIVGRKKDMINCSGFKVYPDEVDAVLVSHEAILEAATIGVPDETRGERVKSFVVLRPGRQLTAEEIRTFCRANLAAYKIPRDIEFLDELPKSSVLKVLRRELRERELRQLAAALVQPQA